MGIFDYEDGSDTPRYLEEIDYQDTNDEYSEFEGDPEYEKRKQEIQEWFKVGLFMNIGLKEFRKMELIDRYLVSKEIDRRIAPYVKEFAKHKKKSSGGEGEGLMPLNYMHLSVILSLATMMNSDDE